MFGIFADLISSVTTIILPSYLSYKSLRTGDPAQTTPWLIYFIILSLFLLAESWTLFIIGWLPFYSWFRLFFLLYLVLPQTQGAKLLYLTYFEPFIIHHENEIDSFIGQTHARLEELGLSYVNIVIEWIREKILGQASPQPQGSGSLGARAAAGGAQQNYAAYASDLLSRFAMPAARSNAAPAVSSGGVLNMLSSAATSALGGGAAVGSARGMGPAATEASGIPDHFVTSSMNNMSSDQKQAFISTQRDRLSTLLRSLDKEQQSLDLAYGGPSSSSRGGGLNTKSRSEQSFDRIEYDDIHSSSGTNSNYTSQHSTPPKMGGGSGAGQTRRTPSGGWMGGWLGGAGGDERAQGRSGGNSPREERPRDDRDRRRGDGDDYANRGWSTARDITESIVRNAGDRYYDRDER